MRRQRKITKMKEEIKTAEKEVNEMEISNQSDAEFKTLVVRMLKELSDLSSIKKTHSETKHTLIEIKNNLQETTIECIKPRIKSAIWNIRKQKTTNQKKKKKKIQKNE